MSAPTVIIHTGSIVRDVTVNRTHGTYKVHRLPSGWFVFYRGDLLGTERTRKLAQHRIVRHVVANPSAT